MDAFFNPTSIWAVGRNYADHAKELGNEIPSSPLIFLKSGACAESKQTEVLVASDFSDLHHEVEIAIELDAKLQPRRLGLALDLTERTIQNQLKAKAQPWTRAKSFRGACPLSSPLAFSWELWPHLHLELLVNGDPRQSGSVQQMIFPLPELLHHLKMHYPLKEGDLVLTGTPSGVGPIHKGDRLDARLKDQNEKLVLQAFWQLKTFA